MDILESYTKEELMKALFASSKAMQPYLEQRRTALLSASSKEEMKIAFDVCKKEIDECNAYHNNLLAYMRDNFTNKKQ